MKGWLRRLVAKFAFGRLKMISEVVKLIFIMFR